MRVKVELAGLGSFEFDGSYEELKNFLGSLDTIIKTIKPKTEKDSK